MAAEYNVSIMKYENDGITVLPSVDYSGWDIKYLVKKSKTDKDAEALLDIPVELITVEGVNKIFIPFTVETLENVEVGNYHHSLKVSNSSETGITLMYGTLSIVREYQQFPKVV